MHGSWSWTQQLPVLHTGIEVTVSQNDTLLIWYEHVGSRVKLFIFHSLSLCVCAPWSSLSFCYFSSAGASVLKRRCCNKVSTQAECFKVHVLHVLISVSVALHSTVSLVEDDEHHGFDFNSASSTSFHATPSVVELSSVKFTVRGLIILSESSSWFAG